MLGKGEAAARLKKIELAPGRPEAAARLARLPWGMRKIAEVLLGMRKDDDPRSLRALVLADQDPAATEAVRMLPSDRHRLWQAVFPQLAPYIDPALRLIETGPYQTDWSRRAFRAPDEPQLYTAPKSRFIGWLAGIDRNWEQDPAWYAAWGTHVQSADYVVGPLLAAAINGGGPVGEEVFRALEGCAYGEHEVGGLGRHVVTGLLLCSRPDAWAVIEKVLLSAQRQEGLRQVIMESVDLAHPDAFRRMLRVILDHDLLRFSSVLRAVCVWFGIEAPEASAKELSETLEAVHELTADHRAPEGALASAPGRRSYYALWAMAQYDVNTGIRTAGRLLSDADVERRFAAVYMLSQIGLTTSVEAAVPAIDDPDLRVAWTALSCVPAHDLDYHKEAPRGIPGAIERLVRRLPDKKREMEPILWPWMRITVDRRIAAGCMAACAGNVDAGRLIEFLPLMEPYQRSLAVRSLAKRAKEPQVRSVLIQLLGDPSSDVRQGAVTALENTPVELDEAAFVEGLLKRKAADLRAIALERLLKQHDGRALESAARLCAAEAAEQRAAGREIASKMMKSGRRASDCRRLIEVADAALAKESGRKAGPRAETEREWKPEECLGLLAGLSRTPGTAPRDLGVRLETDRTWAILRDLDNLIAANATRRVSIDDDVQGRHETQLGGEWVYLPRPTAGVPAEADARRLPLHDLWLGWWHARGPQLRDADGLEILRAAAYMGCHFTGWFDNDAKGPDGKLHRASLVASVVQWVLRLDPPAEGASFLVDALETALARSPGALTILGIKNPWAFRGDKGYRAWGQVVQDHRAYCPDAWDAALAARVWRLARWVDEPRDNIRRHRADVRVMVDAYRAGAVTDGDVVDHLLGPRGITDYGGTDAGFDDLGWITRPANRAIVVSLPGLAACVDRVRRRVVEVEVKRGDLPTAASEAAGALRDSGGMETLLAVLSVPGLPEFVRDPFGWRADAASRSRPVVLSRLIQSTRPRPGETPEVAAPAIRDLRMRPEKLVSLAMLAPQWAAHVEAALEWPGLVEGVWWLYAHTKDASWQGAAEERVTWAAEIEPRTGLAADDLIAGAVDAVWFRTAYDTLGPDRWKALNRHAKFTATGAGHKRALLFADAIRGAVTSDDLRSRIDATRNQDAVRALGLCPPVDGEDATQHVLSCFLTLQEFRRTSRQFGSMRQASERAAIETGMQNLARAAGYADPLRLEWAMEREAVADFADGPLTAEEGALRVTLAIEPTGMPRLTCAKDGKTLASVPAAAKKTPAIGALVAREREVRKQSSRIRKSLEQAMCRGDAFTAHEMVDLSSHPVVAPMMGSLVFVSEAGMGYPIAGGTALEDHAGRSITLDPDARVRVAHAWDLLSAGEWHLWQRDCFLRERVQAIKQVFRELYVLTAGEREERTQTSRYAGHQVNPKQALALLGPRGWVSHPEEGPQRTFHAAGITARLGLECTFWTPAEIEAPALGEVFFTCRGEWERVPLEEIPPLIFSEVMRDVDLVVSVAHVGGVDPEVTASTVEMRASVVRETCRLMGIGNVERDGNWERIEGSLTRYSVHLGSANVHQETGGEVVIVAVHGQHRGRVFLPFLDDDPRTAEVVSKVLLLAKDQEIRDPSILSQIMRTR